MYCSPRLALAFCRLQLTLVSVIILREDEHTQYVAIVILRVVCPINIPGVQLIINVEEVPQRTGSARSASDPRESRWPVYDSYSRSQSFLAS